MTKLYDFKRLIRKYGVPFELQRKTDGAVVSGRWEDGSIKTFNMFGAIVPMSENKIYHSGGTYTTDDRELYMSEAIGFNLTTVKVIYKGNVYAVQSSRNFEEYADVYVYTLKWVGAGK